MPFLSMLKTWSVSSVMRSKIASTRSISDGSEFSRSTAIFGCSADFELFMFCSRNRGEGDLTFSGSTPVYRSLTDWRDAIARQELRHESAVELWQSAHDTRKNPISACDPGFVAWRLHLCWSAAALASPAFAQDAMSERYRSIRAPTDALVNRITRSRLQGDLNVLGREADRVRGQRRESERLGYQDPVSGLAARERALDAQLDRNPCRPARERGAPAGHCARRAPGRYAGIAPVAQRRRTFGRTVAIRHRIGREGVGRGAAVRGRAAAGQPGATLMPDNDW